MSASRRLSRGSVIAALLGALICGGYLLSGITSDRPASEVSTAGIEQASVVRVIDGDTIVVRSNGADMTVRILGVDTPETVHPDKPVQCYGPEASTYLHNTLPEGTTVSLVTDSHQGATDRYGRELRHVLTGPDDAPVLIAEQLLSGGYGIRYTAARTDLDSRLEQAERAARKAGAGLWGACPTR